MSGGTVQIYGAPSSVPVAYVQVAGNTEGLPSGPEVYVPVPAGPPPAPLLAPPPLAI